MPIREKFQLEFDKEQDVGKSEKTHSSSLNHGVNRVESESKHKIKIVLNILSDEELGRMADKQE